MAGKGKKNKKLNDSDSDVFIPEEKKTTILGWFLQPAVLFLIAVGAAIVLFGPQFPGWLPDLARRPEYQVKPEDIHITELPPWIGRTFLRQVAREGGLPESLSLLDERVVDRVAAAFQKHPWVERVVSVRKDLATGLVVSLEYRKPVGIVVIESQRYPIDRSAVLLPPADDTYDTAALPTIRNARSTPQGSAGTPWGDRTIEGAARLAEVVGPSWTKLNLESIDIPDVSSTLGRSDEAIYEIRTAGGSRIVWGRAPGSDHPGELTPEQKVGRLEEYFARNGGFSDAHGPYEIDIRHWQEITRQPLSERPGPSRN